LGSTQGSQFDILIKAVRGILSRADAGAIPSKQVIQNPPSVVAPESPLSATEAVAGNDQALPFPISAEVEPILTLEAVIGTEGQTKVSTLQNLGQIVFHAVGDTGNANGTRDQETVAGRMVSDYNENDPAKQPCFFLHLGDVVYSFGEAERYYDQFYNPYRNYPGPIVAIAGHHDGMAAPGASGASLMGFLSNFCASAPIRNPEAGDVNRSAQIQPAVYFTFELPFVRILALYSNCLGGPGIISSQGGEHPGVLDSQLSFLTAALLRAKSEQFLGALIIAVHHPPYCASGSSVGRGDSRLMLKDFDSICQSVGLWPHAVLSAHSDNYQRFTRFINGSEIPYVVAGAGGHGIDLLTDKNTSAGARPYILNGASQDGEMVTLDRCDDQAFGNLRVTADAQQLQLEYRRATGETFDSVVVDLATRKRVDALAGS
jgi:hypothetical protein